MPAPELVKWMLTARTGGKSLAALVTDFQRWLGACPAIRRCTVHGDAGKVIGPNGQRNTDGVDAIAELWAERGLHPDAAALPWARVRVHAVREIVEKGPARLAPGPVPGVTILARLTARPGLTHGEVLSGYGRHAPLALRVHAAMDRYVRHVVVEDGGESPSPWFGFSLLHYATDQDRHDRHYESPEGRQAILDDQKGFLDCAALQVMEARSWVVC